MADTVEDLLNEVVHSTDDELEYKLIIETPIGSYQVDGIRWEHKDKHLVIEAGDIE